MRNRTIARLIGGLLIFLTALVPFVTPVGAVDEAGCDEQLDENCLRWDVRSFAFSPDSKSLFFSYRYIRGSRPASYRTLVRLEVDAPYEPKRIVEYPYCATGLDQTRVSPDGKSIAVRIDNGVRVGVMDLKTGAIAVLATA